jgi:hypothetical protein
VEVTLAAAACTLCIEHSQLSNPWSLWFPCHGYTLLNTAAPVLPLHLFVRAPISGRSDLPSSVGGFRALACSRVVRRVGRLSLGWGAHSFCPGCSLSLLNSTGRQLAAWLGGCVRVDRLDGSSWCCMSGWAQGSLLLQRSVRG